MAVLSIEARLGVLTDVEVIRELWDVIGRLDDSELSDQLYWLTGEIIERWSPQAEMAATWADYEFDKNRDREMEAHEKSLKRRADLRAALMQARKQVG